MGKGEGKGHILLRVGAGIAEHHSLVSGSLIQGVFPDYAPVYVTALLVDGGKDPAGVAVEHQSCLVVPYLIYDMAGNLLDVDIGVVASDLPAHDHKSRGTEGLAGHLGLRVLTEELVEDGIGYLVGHLVGMAFGN